VIVNQVDERGFIMPVVSAPTDPTHDLGGARFTSLATPSRGSRETSVWRVQIDPGAPAAAHSLTREEVFVVLRGRAQVSIGDDHAVAEPGDAIVVPAGTRFALGNAGADVLELVCCLPVGGQATMDGSTFTPPWAQ
jgi:quercetin dioxygenase-like cupin family protein